MSVLAISPIIKCVGFNCNMSCAYCFYREDENRNTSIQQPIMKRDVLKKFIKEMFQLSQKNYNFIWHGGEPLLAGIEFFQNAVKYQEHYNSSNAPVSNRIQTNGVLLNNDWIDFFLLNKFTVGISLDGPEHIHNMYRKINNENSYKTVVGNLRLAQEKNLPFGVISVVTSYSARFAEEIYRFFLLNGIRKLSFNPTFEIDRQEKVLDFSVSPKDYSNFLLQILKLWTKDDNPEIKIRQIQEPLEGLLRGKTTVCSYSGNCASNISILPNGNITACHEEHGTEKFLFGNLQSQSFQEIFDNPTYQNYKKLLNGAEKCQKCQWYKICNGGCAHHRNLKINGKRVHKYIYCDSRRKIFSELKRQVKTYHESIKLTS